MKTLACVLLFLVSAGSLSGCSGGGSAASPPAPPTPAKINGVDTPKSVAVVTAT
jgi:hypothetical protein